MTEQQKNEIKYKIHNSPSSEIPEIFEEKSKLQSPIFKIKQK